MNQDNNQPSQLTLKDIIVKIISAFKYYKSKWLIILIIAVVFGLCGVVISFFLKPKYIATCTFVLDDGNRGGLGQYAGLASLAGINMGGGSSSNIFQGDNILELYKSRLMIEKALLQKADFGGKNELLLDRYIDFNELRENWKKRKQNDTITFAGDPDKFSRKQDSIITDIVNLINLKVLDVEKLDKKLSIITVNVTFGDELFAKEFTSTLVQTVNDFYSQTTTKKTYQNIVILQHQADSVKAVINSSIGGAALDIDAIPNANPQLSSLRVPSQKRQIDVQASTAIYAEIVKNLEITKISFRQELPLIQIIDEPVLPLPKKSFTKAKCFILGIMLGGFLAILYLTFKKAYSIVMR